MISPILLFLSNLLTSAPTGPPLHPHHHEKRKLFISKTAPPATSTQLARPCRHTSRIVTRKIQTLWQENLLVRYRKGPRTKVLSFRQQARLFQTRDGLCSTGVQRRSGTNVVRLQIGARNSGRNLQHQSRVIVPTRGVLAVPCRRPFARQRSPCSVFL